MAFGNPTRWYLKAIFYELRVRAFRDSDNAGHGDLAGVIEKLDYLQHLGIDCVWLMPICPSPMQDDGYDIADYTDINPDYGTLEVFDRLIAQAHARGLRVIADLPVNHTSDQHAWFVESRSSRQSPKRDWYVWSDTDQRYQDVRVIFTDTEVSNWAFDSHTNQYYWHRFYASQPDLNYDNPVVREAMLDVMRFWLKRGIDGFRIDAVPYLVEREGTACEHLPETHAVIQEMRRMLDAEWPDAILLAEANGTSDVLRGYYGAGDEFHMAFHFPLMPRIFEALHFQKASPIIGTLRQIPPLPEGCQWATFLRNHDELTLEAVSDGERQLMRDAYAPDEVMRFSTGIRRRLAPLMNNDRRKIALANAILFSLPGAPTIYYGDEIGMGDNLDLPDRDGVRTPMQWDNSTNAGFSEAAVSTLHMPVNSDSEYGYQRVNVSSQMDDPDSLLNWMRSLIALRKRHSALSEGDLEFIESNNPALLMIKRQAGGEAFFIIHNLSANEQEISLEKLAIGQYTIIDALRSAEADKFEEPQESRSLAFKPFQSVWLLLKPA